MIKKYKDIEFYPLTEETQNVLAPVPSKKCVPDWYKKLKAINRPTFENISMVGALIGQTVKGCPPFFDGLTMGYMQRLWTDVVIKLEPDTTVSFKFARIPQPINVRDHIPDVKLNKDLINVEFTWQHPWGWNLPKGYSAIVIPPFNRFDLPFVGTGGILDAVVHTEISTKELPNVPFYLRKSAFDEKNELFLPMYTPMYQIIPFKRDDWKSTYSEFDKKRTFQLPVEGRFTGGYRKGYWKKKVWK